MGCIGLKIIQLVTNLHINQPHPILQIIRCFRIPKVRTHGVQSCNVLSHGISKFIALQLSLAAEAELLLPRKLGMKNSTE